MKKALLIVDHGSRFPEANEMINDVVAMLRRLRPELIVHGSHMELAEPTIAAGLKTCIDDGATEIVVHPYMLSPGRHAIQDIPRIVKESASAYPEASIRITGPLGVDTLLGDLVLKRADL